MPGRWQMPWVGVDGGIPHEKIPGEAATAAATEAAIEVQPCCCLRSAPGRTTSS